MVLSGKGHERVSGTLMENVLYVDRSLSLPEPDGIGTLIRQRRQTGEDSGVG